MRLIDADALIEFCAERWIPLNIDAVNMQPTIQPEERTEKRTETHGVCLDAISRKLAIDALDKQIKQCCKALESLSLSDVDKHAVKVEMASLRAYRGMLENLPTVQPEPQWIPVSERLPEEKDAGILKKLGTEKKSEYVLATVEVKGERMTVTACTYDGKWDWNMKYAFPDFKVIAWMPLPEPYTK